MRKRLAKLAPQLAYLAAIRAELPEDGIFVDEVTQLGFAARLAFPVYRPRTFLSPGYQDNLGYGFAKQTAERNSVMIFAASIVGAAAVFGAVWTGHGGYLQ